MFLPQKLKTQVKVLTRNQVYVDMAYTLYDKFKHNADKTPISKIITFTYISNETQLFNNLPI